MPTLKRPVSGICSPIHCANLETYASVSFKLSHRSCSRGRTSILPFVASHSCREVQNAQVKPHLHYDGKSCDDPPRPWCADRLRNCDQRGRPTIGAVPKKGAFGIERDVLKIERPANAECIPLTSVSPLPSFIAAANAPHTLEWHAPAVGGPAAWADDGPQSIRTMCPL